MQKLKDAFSWVKTHVTLVLTGIIALMYLIIKLKNSKLGGLEADASLNKTEVSTAAAEQQVKDLDKSVQEEQALQAALKKAEEKPTEGATYYDKKYGDK